MDLIKNKISLQRKKLKKIKELHEKKLNEIIFQK